MNIRMLEHLFMPYNYIIQYSPTTTSHYHVLLRVSTRGYMERAAVPHTIWLHVPRPCSTLSRMLHAWKLTATQL